MSKLFWFSAAIAAFAFASLCYFYFDPTAPRWAIAYFGLASGLLAGLSFARHILDCWQETLDDYRDFLNRLNGQLRK